MPTDLRAEFIRFCVNAGILTFGQFTTKAGRVSPYFFNAGLVSDGVALHELARFYAQTIIRAEQQQGLQFDMLFGPAYKGITLASATAVELGRSARRVPFAFNRKEVKDHGEGGQLVGAPVKGRVLIIDDVISAGTSVRDSVEIVEAAGARVVGVVIALDRQERSGTAEQIGEHSAVQEVRASMGLAVYPIATLTDLLKVLNEQGNGDKYTAYRNLIATYRKLYGASDKDD